ncbi:MAG: hypothetical protein COX40_01465 [Candidatus Omnitrophica bacterium CG23_combo_of_CG06-09_8_20_14_all_40_11]|nr:MAG: hypothetical protein COX40_01465 [Candidatus Omnitrophica bacterium CG23_combo_of_CG06-09_8_20_14_all_40_11]
MNSWIVRISVFILAVAALIFALSNIYTIEIDTQGTAWILNRITGNAYKYYDPQKGFTGYNILQRNEMYKLR